MRIRQPIRIQDMPGTKVINLATGEEGEILSAPINGDSLAGLQVLISAYKGMEYIIPTRQLDNWVVLRNHNVPLLNWARDYYALSNTQVTKIMKSFLVDVRGHVYTIRAAMSFRTGVHFLLIPTEFRGVLTQSKSGHAIHTIVKSRHYVMCPPTPAYLALASIERLFCLVNHHTEIVDKDYLDSQGEG